MNSWALMVVAIVLIVSITSILRARMGIRKDRHGNELPLHDSAETERMREDMKALKERVAVLERIATDRNHLLEQEFDRLRDR
jgi:cbb3-type cytochrome oxidase subunit 3